MKLCVSPHLKNTARDRPKFICRIKKQDLEGITKIFQNWKSKIHKANKTELTSFLWYVITPKSMNYEIIAPMIVSNSLKCVIV